MSKRIVAKSIILIVLIAITETIMSSLQPVILGNIAVTQLEDAYTSNSGLKVYQSISQYSFIGYILIGIAMFYTDIKKFSKKSN